MDLASENCTKNKNSNMPLMREEWRLRQSSNDWFSDCRLLFVLSFQKFKVLQAFQRSSAFSTGPRILTNSLKVTDKSTCLNYTTTIKDAVFTHVFPAFFINVKLLHLKNERKNWWENGHVVMPFVAVCRTCTSFLTSTEQFKSKWLLRTMTWTFRRHTTIDALRTEKIERFLGTVVTWGR